MVRSLFTTIMCALLLSIKLLRLSSGLDTLLPNQTLSIAQTLISRNQDFEMGFFTPGRSPNRYMGIWYKNTPDVVIWVANRNNPISDSHDVAFSVSGNGTLVISKPGSIIWSTNPSGVASNPILQLRDTGNLVLVNETMEEDSPESYIWQSFDYPTDTILPGMKIVDDVDAGVEKYMISWRNSNDPSPGEFFVRIENHGLPDLVFYRGNTKTFRMGKWNGLYFDGYPRFPNPIFKPELVFRGEHLISISIDPHNKSILKRATLDTSGIVHSYTTNARKDKWNLVYAAPADQCDNYGLCGPNGICSIDKPNKKAIKKNNEDLELPLLKFSTVVAATNNFSTKNVIGEGGFGPVYKGIIPSEGEVAIKRLSRTSGQGLEEFKSEAILIAKLQHKNLVRLLGCCIEGEERMLIYEYLPNKSLDYFVFDKNRRELLTWLNRFDIIMGISRGLLYLHHDSRLKIIHRDLKTSNILLDGDFNPKISDFGLARIFGEDQPTTRTKRVVGTYGYMAPEYAMAGKFSVKSDVFSMGVVLLEIVSEKKIRGFERSSEDFHSLLGHAWLLWKENKTLELMDECLKDTFVESEVKRCIHVGLLCVQQFQEDRPTISSVISMLGTDGAILPEPKEPGFFIGRGSTPERPSPMSERNSITITDLEAR